MASLKDVTIAVINYNGRGVLASTLQALRKLCPQSPPVVLVDNGSRDGSPDWVRHHYPEVEVVLLGTNGTKPSRARNWALKNVHTPYILLLDNDVILEPGCLEKLLEVMRTRETILACSPRLVTLEDPTVIHFDVGRLHYLCVSGASERGTSVSRRSTEGTQPTLPGGNALVNRALARQIGYFDPAYDFGWGDDAEFYIRGRIAGLDCLHVPAAVAGHPIPRHGTRRAEAQMHNRYRVLLSIYSARSLLLLAPMLVAFEVAMLVTGLATGLLGAQLRAARRIIKSRKELLRTRNSIQASRRCRDSAILEGSGISGADILTKRTIVALALRFADSFFAAYWWAVRRGL
ncbi:MAG: glycosyltransferase [Acidobacteriota bacterium]